MKEAASKTKMVAKNRLTINASIQHLHWFETTFRNSTNQRGLEPREVKNRLAAL
jgi:hypothetical protein